MILLLPNNRIIEETLKASLTTASPEKLLSTLCDFDNVRYQISTPSTKTKIMLSMSLPCMQQLRAYGVDKLLEGVYGKYMCKPAEEGWDITLEFDLEAMGNADIDELIRKASNLKRNALSAPFQYAFTMQSQGSTTEIMRINYRNDPDESFYVQAQEDRVTVFFSTVFQDETDNVFGKVFLQEFVDARRLPSIQNAPQVLYSARDPPLELRHFNLPSRPDIGYITFVFFPRHFATPALRESCISQTLLFRNYLHYHIKCSKSYMHARMRGRVDGFMKVLNRAKRDAEGEKKTVGGKTFKRS